MYKWVIRIKFVLIFICIYLIFASSVPYYWCVVALYWTLNFLTDVIRK